MAKYKFRLETLRKVREVRRDRERAALAEAFRAEQVLAERRAELKNEAEQLRDWRRSAAAEQFVNINRLVEAQRYDLVLRAQEQELDRQQSMLAVETQRRRQVLIEADREVHVMEKLDERHRDEHKRQAERAELKQLDEVAVQRHAR